MIELTQLHSVRDVLSLSYGLNSYHFSYHVKHKRVNSLNHANIFSVCTVLICCISARKVARARLTFSRGSLARHDPLSGLCPAESHLPHRLYHSLFALTCLGVAKALQ